MQLHIFPTALLLMVFFIILAASAVATAPACSEAIARRGTFTLGGTSFQYMGADDATGTEPKVRLKNLVSGETVDRDVGLQATFLLVSGGTVYHFGSFGDYDQMDYDIILHNPCNRGLGCTEIISKGEQFTIGGTSFEYRGADPAGGTVPKIRFKNLVTGETVDRDVGLHATFRLPEGGVSYGFGSFGAFGRDDYNIIWLYPCEGRETAVTKASAERPRGMNRARAWLKKFFAAPQQSTEQPQFVGKATKTTTQLEIGVRGSQDVQSVQCPRLRRQCGFVARNDLSLECQSFTNPEGILEDQTFDRVCEINGYDECAGVTFWGTYGSGPFTPEEKIRLTFSMPGTCELSYVGEQYGVASYFGESVSPSDFGLNVNVNCCRIR